MFRGRAHALDMHQAGRTIALLAGIIFVTLLVGACSTAQTGAQGQWTFGPTLPPSSAAPSAGAPSGPASSAGTPAAASSAPSAATPGGSQAPVGTFGPGTSSA